MRATTASCARPAAAHCAPPQPCPQQSPPTNRPWPSSHLQRRPDRARPAPFGRTSSDTAWFNENGRLCGGASQTIGDEVCGDGACSYCESDGDTCGTSSGESNCRIDGSWYSIYKRRACSVAADQFTLVADGIDRSEDGCSLSPLDTIGSSGAPAPPQGNAASLEICAQRCMNSTACRSFQYHASTWCGLFRDCGFNQDPGSYSSPARVYGYRAPAVPAYVFEELTPQGECRSTQGEDRRRVVLDQANCLSACRLDPSCTAVEINDDVTLNHNCELHFGTGNNAIIQTESKAGFRCWQKQSTYLGCYQVSWPTVATVGVASDGARAVQPCALLVVLNSAQPILSPHATSHPAPPSARRLRQRRGGVRFCMQSTQPAGRCLCAGVRWFVRHRLQVPPNRGLQPI